MDPGSQSSLGLIKILSVNVIKDFHIIIESWIKNDKKSSYDDKNCLIKSLVSNYFKDAFGWAKYNSSIKRCRFITENDSLGNLKSIEVLTYRNTMDWWQKTLSDSLQGSIESYNVHKSYIKESSLSEVVPTSVPEKEGSNCSISLRSKVTAFNGVDELVDQPACLPDPKEDVVNEIPFSLSEEIAKAINFESITNIKF